VLLHLLKVQELRRFLDAIWQLLLHLVPQLSLIGLVTRLHIPQQLVPLKVVLVQLLLPERVETVEFVLVRLVEVVLFLVVPLLHLVNSAGLEVLLEFLGVEAGSLGLNVVGTLLVFLHLGEGAVEEGLQLVGSAVLFDVTHFCNSARYLLILLWEITADLNSSSSFEES
jgi:hypothetical protein